MFRLCEVLVAWCTAVHVGGQGAWSSLSSRLSSCNNTRTHTHACMHHSSIPCLLRGSVNQKPYRRHTPGLLTTPHRCPAGCHLGAGKGSTPVNIEHLAGKKAKIGHKRNHVPAGRSTHAHVWSHTKNHTLDHATCCRSLPPEHPHSGLQGPGIILANRTEHASLCWF